MKIIPEPERLDARVPLGLLAVAIVTLVLSALFTIGVQSISEYNPRSAALSGPRPRAEAQAPAAKAAALFDRYMPAPATRQPPEKLREYGWVNQERGLVHIPIERAKQLILARRAGATQPASHREAERHSEAESRGEAQRRREVEGPDHVGSQR
jgi:hypothetical protein